MFWRTRLDALVIASTHDNLETLTRAVAGGPPVVLLDRNFDKSPFNFIGADDYKIGELATEHLISLKRKKIAHIRGPQNNVGQRRFEGYRDSLLRHKLPYREEFLLSTSGSSDTNAEGRGRAAMDQILSLRTRPDAVFCFNDVVAVGALMRALEAGVRVPEDMALIGCGNYHYDALLKVALSSVDQHVEELGLRLAKLVFSLLDAEGPTRRRSIILQPTLVARHSTLGHG